MSSRKHTEQSCVDRFSVFALSSNGLEVSATEIRDGWP